MTPVEAIDHHEAEGARAEQRAANWSRAAEVYNGPAEAYASRSIDGQCARIDAALKRMRLAQAELAEARRHEAVAGILRRWFG